MQLIFSGNATSQNACIVIGTLTHGAVTLFIFPTSFCWGPYSAFSELKAENMLSLSSLIQNTQSQKHSLSYLVDLLAHIFPGNREYY